MISLSASCLNLKNISALELVCVCQASIQAYSCIFLAQIIIIMILLTTGLLILTVLIFNNRRLLYVLYKTFRRDMRGLYRFLRFHIATLFWTKSNATIPKAFSKLVKKHPHKIALYYEDQEWSYQKLDDFSNRIANYFKNEGYKKGDSIALLLENRPEYVGIWLGLSKIGVVTALINTNLVSAPLVHSIFAADNKGLIFGSNFSEAITQIKEKLAQLHLFEFKDGDKPNTTATDLNAEIEKYPPTTPEEISEGNIHDKLVYIYTSGTTGLPKAAVIPQSRYFLASGAGYYLLNLTPNDIIYNPLPLYHSVGGMLTVSLPLVFGVSVVLRKKFSASNYWTDCQKYNCTAANYVGELCRYVLAAHKPGTKIEHKVKLVFGNGLRAQIWEKFKDTFGIGQIYEFYGATEGNSQLANLDGKVGAVGFIPVLARGAVSSILVKCDLSTGEPIRSANGLFTKCKTGEPGLFLGKINQAQSIKAFSGYADKSATQKKILKDVLVEGDVYFNTGDILVEDEFGYFYFRDRTGDTFRWKGENVATCEVEAIISNIVGYNDATVYGVEVPGTEGKAGMAAIVDPDGTLDLKALAKGLKSQLPSYAVPLFLRTMNSVPTTGTFKLKKVDLQKEGFDIEKIKDGNLYFLDSKSAEYIPLTKDIYDDIANGRLRL